MSEVFGDDFPDCRPTPADRVKAAVAALLAVQESSVERAHAEATLAVEVDALAREVARLDAHLQTREACHHVRVQELTNQVAELERSLRELAPAPAFRHLYRQDQTGVGTECGRPWTTKEHELATDPALPVCWECVRAVLDKQEERELDVQRQTAQRLSRDNAALRHSLVATRTALRASNENATVLGKRVGQLAAQLQAVRAAVSGD